MKEYVLIFRMDITTPGAQPPPDQLQEYMQQWMRWIDDLANKEQLADGGNHFSYSSARLLRPGNEVTMGPYTVNNESVAGYIIVIAKDMDAAEIIAGKCPILNGKGTSVEIREVATPG